MLKRYALLLFIWSLVLSVNAQESKEELQLLTPCYGFSKKKTAYITLADGKEIEGNIKSFKFKKALIKEIKIQGADGQKHKITPDKIKFMYVMPSALGKLAKSLNLLGDAKKWNNEKLNQDFLNQGYVYFETTNVQVKKNKQMNMLMQLLNPSFSKKVKIYDDPWAKKTASVGVAGVTVAGGHEKSYYVQTEGNDVASRFKKKGYKEQFTGLWKSCDAMTSKYTSDNIKWKNFIEHIAEYTECK